MTAEDLKTLRLLAQQYVDQNTSFSLRGFYEAISKSNLSEDIKAGLNSDGLPPDFFIPDIDNYNDTNNSDIIIIPQQYISDIYLNVFMVGNGGNDLIIGSKAQYGMYGGAGNDTIIAADQHGSYISGGAGDDVVYGGGGDGYFYNNIYGEDGDDTIFGGNGANNISGGDGNDSIDGGGYGSIFLSYLSGGSGDDTIRASDGGDIIAGDEGDDSIIGGAGNDSIDGGSGYNQISGGAGDDTLIGGDDSNWLIGEDGNDLIIGGADDDDLEGGRGDDTFLGGGGQDTVYLSGRLSDYSFTYDPVSKTWKFTDYGNASDRTTDDSEGINEGSDILKNITFVTFADDPTTYRLTELGTITPHLSSRNDSNNDFVTDVYWRLPSTGLVHQWVMASDGSISDKYSHELSDADWTDTNWSMAGTGDFNGDDVNDILWRNAATGEVAEWIMGSDGTISTVHSRGIVGLDWQIAGTGYFDIDGITDILWRNSKTGEVAVHLLINSDLEEDADTHSDWKSLGVISSDWKIEATGDFNNDDKTDILWRNSLTGEVSEWIMSDDGDVSEYRSEGQVDKNWSIQGVGDFNNDGIADVLWRNTATGLVHQWIMAADGTIADKHSQDCPDMNWQIGGVGDYNGDGISDILWRNAATGETGEWIMAKDGAIAKWHSQGIVAKDWQLAKV